MKLIWTITCLSLVLFNLSSCSKSEQVADPDFIPKNTKHSFLAANSPVVFIDQAHHNFHTANGRFRPFTQVLISDGYTVIPSKDKFTLDYLNQADILVIANALDKNRRDWTPPFGDAFDTKEVAVITQWVSQGGSVLLIADHMPFPKFIDELALAFGFKFNNGHVSDAIFRVDNNTLMASSITKGNTDSPSDLPLGKLAGSIAQVTVKSPFSSDNIHQVKSFGGSAFQIPKNAEPLLILGKNAISVMPDIPFKINANTPRVSMEGWYQGAVLNVGKGRIAVFSEAMMFTSQVHVPTDKKYGLVSDGAEENEQFLLNVMHWLSTSI